MCISFQTDKVEMVRSSVGEEKQIWFMYILVRDA